VSSCHREESSWLKLDHRYCLIIEEITRGNAPAIFGDLFQLLDRRSKNSEDGTLKKGESEYGITNFDIARIVYNDENHLVKIPFNLSIVATMNTSDQNVFTLDTAFQRRWEMRHIRNDVASAVHANNRICHSDITWRAFVDVVNEQIMGAGSYFASGDKRIGAYFASLSEITDSKKFSEKVLKYLWDDAVKMERGKLFKEVFISADDIIELFETENDNIAFEKIFASDVYQIMIDRSSAYVTAINSNYDSENSIDAGAENGTE